MQAALKLVLEPLFEADFKPCSYGFRPKRRAQDAITEIHHFTSRSYEWVLEGDITACFDEISYVGLMDRVRARVGDKRVLDLVKAFLKAGLLSEDGVERDTDTGTPQGGSSHPCWPTSPSQPDFLISDAAPIASTRSSVERFVVHPTQLAGALLAESDP